MIDMISFRQVAYVIFGKWCRNWTEHKIKKRKKITVKVQLLRFYSRAFGAQLFRQEKSVGNGKEISLHVEKVWKPERQGVEKNSKKSANKVRECQVNKRQEKKKISQTAAK
jgi:hypothetical protein